MTPGGCPSVRRQRRNLVRNLLLRRAALALGRFLLLVIVVESRRQGLPRKSVRVFVMRDPCLLGELYAKMP
jgi:hypothetical protein